ncbi:major facilitator superfamily domain-containing protein [Aspergillus pseudotamarii]|uniref:Major facilitator superfamily domain-containing protein n=1 Tax=Aspergillus pseudotamarii TaxID=132259 RepID=A0A5N6SGN7_ASPPS|nr:major facilitator superfamily domain-containing protein [Aspergillus pseudotamarii]KAE8133795.1 major facilitator superfamily domain-containing protein [Aspergillus pseudotamarii]
MSDTSETAIQPGEKKQGKRWRFWAIYISLCVSILLAAVESTVTSTALPFISDQLHAGEDYVWFVNSFFLTSACFQPLFGQTADLFGRRWLMIGAVAFFVLGSGVSGGAINSAMMIAGRTIQGIGGGGINVMIDMIVSDLLPLRERGNFMGMIFAVFSIGTSLGPFIGGALVQHSSWRWVFYLNLPIGGTALVCLFFFLHVNGQKEPWQRNLKRIDYVGNALLMTSIVSILLALTWGGTAYAWSNWRIIICLTLGLVGMIIFHLYEASPWCAEPMMPPHMFGNRTSFAALILSFIHNMLTFWVVYFIPVYFQSVKLSSSTRAGVQFLPSVILAVPTAMIAGIILTKWGRYQPMHAVGMGLALLGLGLFTRLNANSSDAEWIMYQIITAIGLGLLLTTTLAAVQVGLEEKDVGLATATWAFVRSYGAIWGISIPAAIFNTQFGHLSSRISDPAVAAQLARGEAYSHVSATFIKSLAPQVRDEVISVYSDTLQLVWQVSLAFATLGFIIVWFEKQIKLRSELETEYGIKDPKKEKANEGDVAE